MQVFLQHHLRFRMFSCAKSFGRSGREHHNWPLLCRSFHTANYDEDSLFPAWSSRDVFRVLYGILQTRQKVRVALRVCFGTSYFVNRLQSSKRRSYIINHQKLIASDIHPVCWSSIDTPTVELSCRLRFQRSAPWGRPKHSCSAFLRSIAAKQQFRC